MLQLTRTVTAAEILALHTTPFTLIPAPGAGRTLILLGAVARLKFGGTAYANGGDVVASVGPLANGIEPFAVMGNGPMTAGADQIESTTPTTPAFAGAAASFDNQDCELKNDGAAFITGNSTLAVTVFYSIGITQ